MEMNILIFVDCETSWMPIMEFMSSMIAGDVRYILAKLVGRLSGERLTMHTIAIGQSSKYGGLIIQNVANSFGLRTKSGGKSGFDRSLSMIWLPT